MFINFDNFNVGDGADDCKKSTEVELALKMMYESISNEHVAGIVNNPVPVMLCILSVSEGQCSRASAGSLAAYSQ